MAGRGKRRKKPGPKPGWKKRARGNHDSPLKVRVWKPGKTDEKLVEHLLNRAGEFRVKAEEYETAAHTLQAEIAKARSRKA